jgi:hypothetical protein
MLLGGDKDEDEKASRLTASRGLALIRPRDQYPQRRGKPLIRRSPEASWTRPAPCKQASASSASYSPSPRASRDDKVRAWRSVADLGLENAAREPLVVAQPGFRNVPTTFSASRGGTP